jgi:DoxX
MENGINGEVILAARLLLAMLFLIFGWRKLMDFSGTVKRMVQDGAPLPVLSSAVAIFMELPVAFAVKTRAIALLQNAIRTLEEEIGDAAPAAASGRTPKRRRSSRRINHHNRVGISHPGVPMEIARWGRPVDNDV